MNKKLSETAIILLSLCWKNGTAMSISPQLDEKFEFNNKKYTFTKETLEEIRESGLVKVWGETKTSVCFTGIGETPELIKRGSNK